MSRARSKKHYPEVTPELVRSLFAYDSETGLLTSKKPVGWIGANGYRYVVVGKHRILAHRLIHLLVYGEWPERLIDHVNGIRDDNRLSNLRNADHSENLFNARVQVRSVSGVKGVTWSPAKRKWRAAIRARGSQVHLGFFDTKEHAALVRRCAEGLYHHGFSRNAD